MPVVSVLMASFNHAEYVGNAISSVLDQSFEDLEMIVVDDVSTDESWRIIQDWARRDPRVIAMRNEVNVGPAASYNRALAAASGDIMMSLDSDDSFLPGKVQQQVGFLTTNPEIGVLGTYIQAYPENPALEQWFNQSRDLNDPAIWIWANPVGHSSVAITRWAHEKIGNADEEAILLSDWDVYLRALTLGIPIAVLPQQLTRIRFAPTTLTHSDPARTPFEYLRMGATYWHHHLRRIGRADLVRDDLVGLLRRLVAMDTVPPGLASLAAETIDSSPEGGAATVAFVQEQAARRADHVEALAEQERLLDERTRLLHATEDNLERERETFRWEIAGRDLRLQTLSQEFQQAQERLQHLALIEVSPKAQIRALRSSVPASLKKRGQRR